MGVYNTNRCVYVHVILMGVYYTNRCVYVHVILMDVHAILVGCVYVHVILMGVYMYIQYEWVCICTFNTNVCVYIYM